MKITQTRSRFIREGSGSPTNASKKLKYVFEMQALKDIAKAVVTWQKTISNSSKTKATWGWRKMRDVNYSDEKKKY